MITPAGMAELKTSGHTKCCQGCRGIRNFYTMLVGI